mgnify:CR=1 FL=1
MHDIVIRGGTIIDGTGKPAFTGDLAIAAAETVLAKQADAKVQSELFGNAVGQVKTRLN